MLPWVSQRSDGCDTQVEYSACIALNLIQKRVGFLDGKSFVLIDHCARAVGMEFAHCAQVLKVSFVSIVKSSRQGMERRNRSCRVGISGGLGNQAIGVENLAQIFFEIAFHARAVDFPRGHGEKLAVGCGDPQRGAPRDECFQFSPKFDDEQLIVNTDLGDHEAVSRQDADEVISLKAFYGFANGRASDADFIRKAFFRPVASRCKLQRNNHLFEALMSQISLRSRWKGYRGFLSHGNEESLEQYSLVNSVP